MWKLVLWFYDFYVMVALATVLAIAYFWVSWVALLVETKIVVYGVEV
jgi:hypothetical protein